MAEPFAVLSVILIVWVGFYFVSSWLHLEKYGIEVSPLYVLYKTKRLNEFLRRVAEKSQRLWRIFANIGVAAALVEMTLAIYLLTTNLRNFIYVPSQAGPIMPIIPGVTIDFRWLPYLLISAGLAITIHELAHGVVSFSENIPVKSSGLILAPVTFGGFVEPDDEVFDKSRLLPKLRVLAVGSMTNMIAGLLALMLLLSLFMPSSGVLVLTVTGDGPAYASGMRPWEVIYSIAGRRTSSAAELYQVMAAVVPGTSLTVVTSSGVRNIVTAAAPENNSRAVIGIRDFLNYNPLRVGEINPQLSYHFLMTLNWIYMLMTNLAIFNMFPLFPFDGEAYVYSILKAKLKRGLKESRIIINAISLLLLASNIGLTFIRYGLIPFF